MDSPTRDAVASDGTGTPELTVILCVRNGAESVQRQLDALMSQAWDHDWDVLVVDHDSVDDTASIVTRFAATNPRVRVVRAHGKPGLSFARNVGVANTNARSVAFVDHDDLVADGWVRAMGEALFDHPIVACRFEWNELSPGDNRGLVGGSFQRDGIEQIFGYAVVSGVSGWQRWLWEALGGNDESMTFSGEDFDMSIRAHREHHVDPYFEAAAIYHVARRPGLRRTFRQARAYGRSSVVLYRRYGRGRVDRSAATRRALKTWIWLVLHVFDLRSPEAGAPWARRAGIRVGRVEQSIRSRTIWL